MSSFSEFSQPKPLPFGERLERGFPSKLLLFGEYGLMFGAMALSVPFNRFSGRLGFDEEQIYQASTSEIRKFLEHLKTDDFHVKLKFRFDLGRLESDVQNGLYFHSNIPQQYGVGSSGALVAALFNRYALAPENKPEISPEVLRNDFAVLESYFHGRSSGLDPLISFLNQPVLIDSAKKIQLVDFNLAGTGISAALIDTHQTGATGPLVQYFVDKFNSPMFERSFEDEFIPANNGCIEALLESRKMEFFFSLRQLVEFQLAHFRRMIPHQFHILIQNSVSEKVFLKLLGSGGGGFLLAYADSPEILSRWSEAHRIDLLWVTR